MKQTRKGDRGWLSQILVALSLVCLAFGLFTLGWAVWPAPTDAVQFMIPSGVLPGAPAGETYASLGDYRLNVSWPRRLRAGDVGTITVSLVEGDAEKGQYVERPAQVVLVEPSITSLPVDPAGRAQANLGIGQDLTLTWVVSGLAAGTYPGKVVVSFGFYDETAADLVPVPVAVVDVLVRVTALWGLEAGLAVWFGVVGLVLWGTLFLLGRVVERR